MALTATVIVGLLTAVFVGINIGGSSTGVAFGPASGAGVLNRRTAQGLMFVFALLGGLLVGPNVVETLGTEFVPEEHFTLGASTAVLLFTGASILLANLFKVSTSTSETAVGAVVGMGAALGVLNFATVGHVVTWWFVATMFAFWVSAFIGRYLFEAIAQALPSESAGSRTAMKAIVIGVGCYMGFSAGASNVANAVAPLVGSGAIGMIPGILLAGTAIGVGAFLLGGRTMETVGSEITDLPLEGWVIVMLLAASIITGLSAIGIPASLAITTQACVMGLGWGRTTRRVPLLRTLGFNAPDYEDRRHMETDRLQTYNVDTTRRVVSMWLITPVMAGLLALGTFLLAARFGFLGA